MHQAVSPVKRHERVSIQFEPRGPLTQPHTAMKAGSQSSVRSFSMDPDSAVKALEDIATALQAATEEEKDAFRRECSEEASRLEKGPGYAKTAEFIRSLPEAVGI